MPALTSMHSSTTNDWAEGLHLTVTGLTKDQRQQVRDVVEAAGGRYSPNFSKRCTHLIVSAEQSDASQLKVYLASTNKEKWHAQAVQFEWLMECAVQHRQIPEGSFAVQPPRQEDVGLIQQRLQEVATLTVSVPGSSNVSPGEVALVGASKRSALETEVHSNITTRSAPKQASKRHKQSDPHVSQSLQQAVGVDHPPQTAQAHNSRFLVPFAAPCQPYDDNSHAAQIIGAAPTAQRQHARFEGPRLPARPPTARATVEMEVDVTQAAHIQAGQLSSSIAPVNGLLSHAGHAQAQRTDVNAQPSSRTITSSSRMIDSFGAADARSFADRLHTMQADAVDRAWQKQHQLQRLASNASASTTSAVNATAAAPWPCSLPQASETMSATSGHAVKNKVTGLPGQHQGLGVSSRQVACIPDSIQSSSNVSNSAAASSLPMLHQAELNEPCKPTAAAKPVSTGATELSTETESLVVKLRALSQGRSSCDQSRACRSDGHHERRLPFASRTADRNQPKAEPPALPPSKRSKHTSNAAGAHQPAAARPADQRRPDTARCIQLMQPVHSGTEYDSTTSPQRRSHRLKPRATSPSVSSQRRSSYSSVAEPIQLGSPMQQSSAAALAEPLSSVPTAATSARGAAADAAATTRAAPRAHQQPPASPVQHRQGKPTPLKKGFTPKPTRFRLEAERLSITPPDKSSGLEKVLFRSPVKPAAQPSTGHAASSSHNSRATGGFPCAAPEAGALAKDVAGQEQQARQPRQSIASCNVHMADAEDDQETLTPANSCSSGLQAVSEGVFACMRVILDPELTPEESDRMSEAVKAGGGQIIGGCHLGTGATHVVCHPQTAVKWLAMGLSIVSPPWLLRSLAQGTPDRCLHMSLDASRHLPASAQAMTATSNKALDHDLGPSAGSATLPQDLADREARQSFVQQLQYQEALQHWGESPAWLHVDLPQCKRIGHWLGGQSIGSAQQALQTPQTMLDEVVWCVSDPPEQAKLDTHSTAALTETLPSSIRADADVHMAESEPMLSATQEACQAELEATEPMCSTSEQTSAAASHQQMGRQLSEEDWQEVLYQAPALTLLLPLDRVGACGHCSRSLHVPLRGCTRQQLLYSIYEFYQEQLGVPEQMQMMRNSSSAANVVKEVFVEGRPVKRLSLLHSKINLEGLERVSRDLTGTIYELKLSC